MDSSGKRARRTIEVFALTLALASCTKKPTTLVGASTVPMSAAESTPVAFEFDSLDERPVSSASTRGRIAVLSFITTWDMGSQAQIDFMIAMAKNDGDRVAYAAVVMQDRKERELIEFYASKLGVTFPVALATPDLTSGASAFGNVQAVPTVVVLDRTGRIVWRSVGLTKSDEIRRAMRNL